MAQFINTKEGLVTEAIDGMLRASGDPGVSRIDGYPHIKVVCRTDHKSSRVAIISGGGSGHEPAHVPAANLTGIPDPGAIAVARLLEGLAG